MQERGCEKSGRMIHFKTFLEQERNVHEIPLAPFFGNRFNILFHNAAGTYYLEEHLKYSLSVTGKTTSSFQQYNMIWKLHLS